MTIWEMLRPWEFSPTLCLAFGAAAWLYLRHAQSADNWQRMAFWSGLASLYVVSHTSFEYYAEHEFFMHRLQHLVLHHLGPFLIVLGIPAAALRAVMATPVRARTTAGRFVIRATWLLCHPWLSAALFNLLVLFWLIPAVHFPAMIDWRLYRVMNLGMLINGLLFWAAVLRGVAPGHRLQGTAARVMQMLAVVPAQIVIGALIFFSPHELYPVYTLCGRAYDSLSALQDQQIGGLILWVPGAMMSVAGVLYVVRQRFTAPTTFRS